MLKPCNIGTPPHIHTYIHTHTHIYIYIDTFLPWELLKSFRPRAVISCASYGLRIHVRLCCVFKYGSSSIRKMRLPNGIRKASGYLCSLGKGKISIKHSSISALVRDIDCDALGDGITHTHRLPQSSVNKSARFDECYGDFGPAIVEKLCQEQRLEEAFEVVGILQEHGFPISRDIIYSFLQGCMEEKDLAACRRVHALMVSSGLDAIAVLGDHLIRLFTSCKSLQDASRVFWKLPKPTIHTWNALITANTKLGEGKRAVNLFYMMDQNGIRPDKVTFLCILKACSNIHDVHEGKLIHKRIIKTELGADTMVGNSLIDMYAKCGNLEEAFEVFEGLLNRDVVSWGAMITGYVQHGHVLPAVELFEKMQQQGIKPSKVIFLCAFKTCSILGAMNWGRRIHNELIQSEVTVDLILENSLIDMYTKCGCMEDARNMFDSLRVQDDVSWGTLIAGYVADGNGHSALQLFHQMQHQSLKLSANALSGLMKACGLLGDVVQGMLLHDLILVTGLDLNMVVCSSLIDMYVKCEKLQEAQKVFNELSHKDLVSWGAMIAGYTALGHGLSALELSARMQEGGIKPDKAIFMSLMKACGGIGLVEQGSLIHHHVIEKELESDDVIASALVDMYAKCGHLKEANAVLSGLPNRDVVSWCALIAGYATHGHGSVALDLFEKMQREGIKPNRVAFLCILQACGSIGCLSQRRQIHHQIIKSGFELDAAIGNSLIDMYSKSGSLETARKVFDDLGTQNVVHWGTIMAGYVMNGHDLVAIEFFQEMQEEGIKPNTFVFSSVLKACGSLGALGEGRHVHNQILISATERDLVVGNALVYMYSKCGHLEDAFGVLGKLQNRDAVSWATMIAAHVEHRYGFHALKDFAKMQDEGINPSTATFVCVLKACSSVGALAQGRIVHNLILRRESELDVVIGSTLVDLYCKCGSVGEAQRVLSKLPNQDVVAWGALIAGCAYHGDSRLARHCFRDMLSRGLKPDSGVFTGLLAACSQEGLIEEGHQFFISMIKDFKVIPGIQHYSCMIDLFGRAGCFREAEDLLEIMPALPDTIVWMSLLTSCKTYTNVGMGSVCFEQVLKLGSVDAAGYMLMSNIYADAHMWQDMQRMHEFRKAVDAKKQPGIAWVKVHNGLHEFVVGGQNHPQNDDIHAKVNSLATPMREAGFVPQLDLILEPFSNENTEGTINYGLGNACSFRGFHLTKFLGLCTHSINPNNINKLNHCTPP